MPENPRTVARNNHQRGGKAADVVTEPEDLATGIETEVKFATTPEGLEQAFISPQLGGGLASRTRSLRSVYFDTPQCELHLQGVTLRVRKSAGASPVMTVKMLANRDAGPFQRREIEVRMVGLTPDLKFFDADLTKHLLRITGGKTLEAQFETRVKRRTRQLDIDGAAIEVAFDAGMIVTPGGAELPICEIELELKSGEARALYEFAARAAASLPFRLDAVAKSERGFRLKNGGAPHAVKAKTLALPPATTQGQLVNAVITASLTQFTANWAPLLETDETEPVHQLRVSLRRLRSALKIFDQILCNDGFGEVRAEARRIATAFGEARALDALRETMAQGPMLNSIRPEGFEALMATLDQRRALAYDQARTTITDTATTLFVLKLQALLSRHSWQDSAALAREFASQALDKLLARARKRGRKLPQRSDAERHQLRIALKDLRYAIEFFAGLFGRAGKAGEYLSRLAALQDILGTHNDRVTSEKLLLDISTGCESAVVRAAGYVDGWLARAIPGSDQSLEPAWNAFKVLKPFWR